jgi:hypothetical protein
VVQPGFEFELQLLIEDEPADWRTTPTDGKRGHAEHHEQPWDHQASTRYASGNLFAYALVPEVRIGGDERGRQLDTRFVVQDLNGDAPWARRSSRPRNVRFSPTTTLGMP